jgi:hypothetical protein
MTSAHITNLSQDVTVDFKYWQFSSEAHSPLLEVICNASLERRIVRVAFVYIVDLELLQKQPPIVSQRNDQNQGSAYRLTSPRPLLPRSK